MTFTLTRDDTSRDYHFLIERHEIFPTGAERRVVKFRPESSRWFLSVIVRDGMILMLNGQNAANDDFLTIVFRKIVDHRADGKYLSAHFAQRQR